MYGIQKDAKAIKRELKNIHIESEADGVSVVMTAEQEFVSVTIADETWNGLKNEEFGKKRLAEAFMKAAGKAAKKAQEIAGSKMKGVWKKMGIGEA